MANPTPLKEPLAPDQVASIATLLMEGRRVSEVIAHGLSRRPGWRRHHVIALVEERGWTLDSDGRIPRRLRSTGVIPLTQLAGAPHPADNPPREPVAEYPPEGTVMEGRGANAAAALITRGKRHDVVAIRRAAEKAEKALAELVDALKADEDNAVMRNRLAQLEAEAAALRAKLGVKKRGRPAGASSPTPTPPSGRGGNRPPTAATLAKPINHGTWGGWLQHTKRSVPVTADCGCAEAKDEQMAKLRGKSPKSR